MRSFWNTVAEIRDQPLLRTLQQRWLFGVIRAAERLTPASLQHASLAQLTQDFTICTLTGLGALIKRGQELELIRTDVANELLFAWFRAIDEASDSWMLAHLDQKAILHLSHQTLATINQALTSPSLQFSML